MLKVNLQPKVLTETKEGLRLPWWLPVILGVIVFSGIGWAHWSITQDRLKLETEIKQLDFKLRDFQKILSEYEIAQSEKEYLQGKRDFVNSISQNQSQWMDFFDQLKNKIPKDCWITRFEGARSGDYSIEGATFSFSSIGYFMLQLNDITHINSVNLEDASTELKEGSKGSSKDEDAAKAMTKKFLLKGSMNLINKGEKKKTAEEAAQKDAPPAAAQPPAGQPAKPPAK